MYHIPDISATLKLPSFNAFPFLQKGHLAVYYFFSLSGFLIIRLIYLEMKDSGRFDFKHFYLRRIQRLYPVYYLVLITGIVLYHFLLPLLKIDFEIGYRLRDMVAYYVLFLPNVFKYYHPEIGGILIVLWSIGVEEQFYLLIPGLMYLGRKKIILLLLLVLSASLFVLFLLPSLYRYDNPYFYFILGGLMSVIAEKYTFRFFQASAFQLMVLGLVVISFFTNYLDFENTMINHLVNLIVSALFFTTIAYYPPRVMNNKLLNYLGKISYGIYMYHMIVITGIVFVISKVHADRVFPAFIFICLLNVVVILTTVLIAHVSYQFFEKRFYRVRPEL